ncbi:cell division protein FtsW, partial [Pseudomonas aeruginosa]
MSLSVMRRLKQWLVGSYQTENTAFVPYDRTLLWFTFGLAVV